MVEDYQHKEKGENYDKGEGMIHKNLRGGEQETRKGGARK